MFPTEIDDEWRGVTDQQLIMVEKFDMYDFQKILLECYLNPNYKVAIVFSSRERMSGFIRLINDAMQDGKIFHLKSAVWRYYSSAIEFTNHSSIVISCDASDKYRCCYNRILCDDCPDSYLPDDLFHTEEEKTELDSKSLDEFLSGFKINL